MNLCNRRGRVAVRGIGAIFFAAFFTVGIGCAPQVIPPPPTEPIPPKIWAPGELNRSLAQRQDQFRSVRALANVSYSGREGRGSFQEAILIQRPDRLRLETLTFLGAILIVTVDDKEIVGYHPREGLFVRGARSKENLFRYTQIPLELDEITALLMGLPPVDSKLTSQQNGNSVVFSLIGGRRDVVTFESQAPVPTKWERINRGGEIELSARFSDYTSTPTGLFPSKIYIESHTQGERLEIRFQEPELNVALSPQLFSQEKPANVKEITIEELGR